MLYKSYSRLVLRHFDGPHYFSEASFNSRKTVPVKSDGRDSGLQVPAYLNGFELKILFDNLNAVLFSADMINYKVIQISPVCEKVYGYSPAEFYANDDLWRDVVYDDDRSIADAQLSDLRKGTRIVNRYRIVTRSGEIKWLENKIIPTLDEQGRLLRIDGISNEVTEQVLNENKLREKEKRLKESERKYRFIFENNPMPMWLVDCETLFFLDVNNAAIRHYGYSKEEFLSMSSADIRPESDKPGYAAIFNNVLSPAGVWSHVKKDGTVIKVEIKVDIVDFEGRKAKLAMLNDVTERIKYQERLQESNERYELVTKATNDAIWDWNLCRNELYWSEGYEKLFGYQNDDTQIQVHAWAARIHPDDIARVTNGLLQKINGAGSDFWEDEYRYIKADGSVAYIYDRGYILYENGIPVRMVGAMQDITARKRSEQLLQEQEANLRTIFDNTESSYVFLDTELKIVSFNHRAFENCLFDQRIKLEKGINLIDLLPENRKAASVARYKSVLSGEKMMYEATVKLDDGSLRWYSLRALPVYKYQKDIQGILISADDITDRKNSELEREKITSDLLKKNTALEQFAYIVSHNLRSPVANITGLCNIIATDSFHLVDHARCMEGLALSARKLDEIIIDLNYILQVRREITESKSIVRFSALIHDVKISIHSLVEKEKVTIKTDFLECNQLFTIKSYLNSVFYNLISNSIKYRDPSRPSIIEIKSLVRDNKLVLVFKDNGLGIDMTSNKGKIFGLYKKFHPEIEGKGMGLYMVKTQVEILGGHIDVISEVGVGTQFMIEFDLPQGINNLLN